MFLLGFIGGLALMALLMLLSDGEEEREEDEALVRIMRHEAQAEKDRQQTRNFLYYDGSEMPSKKEEFYE